MLLGMEDSRFSAVQRNSLIFGENTATPLLQSSARLTTPIFIDCCKMIFIYHISAPKCPWALNYDF